MELFLIIILVFFFFFFLSAIWVMYSTLLIYEYNLISYMTVQLKERSTFDLLLTKPIQPTAYASSHITSFLRRLWDVNAVTAVNHKYNKTFHRRYWFAENYQLLSLLLLLILFYPYWAPPKTCVSLIYDVLRVGCGCGCATEVDADKDSASVSANNGSYWTPRTWTASSSLW